MMIAAYAVGADEGVLYVRAEYPKAIAPIETGNPTSVKKTGFARVRKFLNKGI